MTASELITTLSLFKQDTEVVISVDVSTGEHDATRRIYADVIGVQNNGEGCDVTILSEKSGEVD